LSTSRQRQLNDEAAQEKYDMHLTDLGSYKNKGNETANETGKSKKGKPAYL
jgi:hypothetical protein